MGSYTITVQVFVEAEGPSEAGDRVANALKAQGFGEFSSNEPDGMVKPPSTDYFVVRDINF